MRARDREPPREILTKQSTKRTDSTSDEEDEESTAEEKTSPTKTLSRGNTTEDTNNMVSSKEVARSISKEDLFQLNTTIKSEVESPVTSKENVGAAVSSKESLREVREMSPEGSKCTPPENTKHSGKKNLGAGSKGSNYSKEHDIPYNSSKNRTTLLEEEGNINHTATQEEETTAFASRFNLFSKNAKQRYAVFDQTLNLEEKESKASGGGSGGDAGSRKSRKSTGKQDFANLFETPRDQRRAMNRGEMIYHSESLTRLHKAIR